MGVVLDSREYLKSLCEKVKLDPSQIKNLITDLQCNFINPQNHQLVFSNLTTQLECENLQIVLEALLRRMNVSFRRSKSAFTSLWDKIQSFLKVIMCEALAIECKSPALNRIIRQMLQLGVELGSIDTSMIHCDCPWLACDLDCSLKRLHFSSPFQIEPSTCSQKSILELDKKTLLRYFHQFNTNVPLDKFIMLDSCSFLLNEFFNEMHYRSSVVADYIANKETLATEFISGLVRIHSNELLALESRILGVLVEKLAKQLLSVECKAYLKEMSVIFDLLSQIVPIAQLAGCEAVGPVYNEIVDVIDISGMNDTCLGRYWNFTASLMTCELLEVPVSESKIHFTLNHSPNDWIKAKIAVCRVISLAWSELHDLEDVLLSLIFSHESNKLKWNAALALMGTLGDSERFIKMRMAWISEMEGFGNFKVIHFYTQLCLKWSRDCGVELFADPGVLETVWAFFNRLKMFMSANTGNLECCVEDLSEVLMESGEKLESLLRTLLIGQLGEMA
jgi:hypothetical protein